MAAQTSWNALARCAWACWFAILAGCQVPAARVAATGPDALFSPRSLVLTRQILEDNAVEMAWHPFRFGRDLLVGPAADGVTALTKGEVGKRIRLALLGDPGPLPPHRNCCDPQALETNLTSRVGCHSCPAHLDLFPEGAEALAALHQVIANATRRIDVLMFQWESDAVGAEIAEWLAAKAGPDLRVRILVDGGGNLIFGEPAEGPRADVNKVVCWLAHQPYVELIRTRNPLGRFDHRKLVVADGQTAWTGGRNFTGPSFFGQRDLSVLLSGPLVGELQKMFEEFWHDQGGQPGEPLDPGPEPEPNARARLVCTAPRRCHLAGVMYCAVEEAKNHIYVENLYCCDDLLVFKLAQARKRGVDVRVILTTYSGACVMDHTNRVVANRLLRAGIKVYMYPGTVHAKMATVDGNWAYLGTGNFDWLSLRHTRELGLAIAAGPIVKEIEDRLFQPDFRPEWELKEPLPVTIKDYACDFLAGFCL